MSRYYDDDEDDDPYTPRIRPAAMPSPRSKYAPYYSGYANTFEDFLEEFEGLASDCALTDLQRVDTIIRYVDPSLRELCRTLDGSRSRDWPRLRKSLIDVFGNTTPRHQIMRQKLRSYIQDSARKRMYCEDDVSRYYRQFICFGLPLVHTGHLSEEERDAAFWYGFHPDDREVLRPRLLGKNPLQPPDVPFHFEDVFGCARAAFAYDDYFPSPWSHAKQFEPPSLRREQPVVEPAPRNTYGFRAVTRAIASNSEITTTPDELSLSSHSTPFTQLPPSSLPSVLESQHGLVHSVMLDQPEHVPTLSSTPPSPSSISSTFLPSPARLATEDQPEPGSASTPSIIPSSPALLSAPLLTLPIIDDDPKFESAPLPLSSTTLTELECPLSPVRTATDNRPDHEPMSSTASTSPVLPRTPSLAPSFTDDVPELFPTLPARQSASLAHSEIPTSLSSLTKPSPSKSPTSVPARSLPPLRPSPGESCCNLVLEPLATPASSYPLVSPPSSLGELISLLPAQHEVSVAGPTSRHSTPPQRLPGFKTIGSVSTRLEVTPAPTSPVIPFVPQSQQPLQVYEVSSTLVAPRFLHTSTPRLRSGSSFAWLTLALSFVTIAAIVSVLLNVSKIPSTHARKFQSKINDLGNSQNKTRDDLTHRLQLGQYTPCGTRFVFDPGGQSSSTSVQVSTFGTRRRLPAQVEDTQRLHHARRHPPSYSNRRSHRFRPRRWSVLLELADEDSAMFDEDAS